MGNKRTNIYGQDYSTGDSHAPHVSGDGFLHVRMYAYDYNSLAWLPQAWGAAAGGATPTTNVLTEAGDSLVTEAGDNIVQE